MGGVAYTGKFMKLHLSEHDPQHHAWAKRGADKENMKLRILLSYWYYKDVDLDALFAKYFTQPYPDVFADSGAFSAMTQGVKISLDEYADWIKKYQHLFSAYSNLDVIRNAEQTWINQQELEALGIQPLPCFHVSEDWKWLEMYVEKYPYIALGVAGMQRLSNSIMGWITKCFQVAGKKAVFHGFGLTSWQVMSSFPWYSVDSSSWGSGFRFGQVPVWDEQKGQFAEIVLGNRKTCNQYAPLVRQLGFDPLDFYDRTKNDRAKICAISALSYMKAEQFLRRRWGEIYIPGREGAPEGLRAHLVTASSTSNMSIPAIVESGIVGEAGLRLHLSDTSNGINYGDADKGIKVHLADTTLTMTRPGDINSAMEVLHANHPE